MVVYTIQIRLYWTNLKEISNQFVITEKFRVCYNAFHI